jgi:hypothetical protein
VCITTAISSSKLRVNIPFFNGGNILLYKKTEKYTKTLFRRRLIKFMVTHNWPEKTKPECYQWKKPEWNKAESIRQKEQARIFIYRIGLRQNASTEQGRIFYTRKKDVFHLNHFDLF